MKITIDLDKLDTVQRVLAQDFLNAYFNQFGKSKIRHGIDELRDSLGIEPAPQDVFKQTPEQAFSKPVMSMPQVQQAEKGYSAQIEQAAASIVADVVDLDKNGFPWDARIHSSNKAKVADGTWRKKRGVDDATVALVESQLRAVMGAPAPVAVTQPAVAPPPPPPPSANEMPPIPASLVKAPATNPRSVYVALMGRTAAAIAGGKVTQEQVLACCTTFGIPSLPLLANRLDLVAQVAAAIDALIGA